MIAVSERIYRSDVLIIGGGVIGLTTAWRLVEQGLSVVVCDRQFAGREASWAGAGMLPPGNLERAFTPEARLRSYSASLWPGLSLTLREQSGIDNEFRICGAVEFTSPDDPESLAQKRTWEEERLRAEEIDADQIERLTGSKNELFHDATYLPDFGQVRNPRHLKALGLACRHLGVQFAENTGPIRFVHHAGTLSEVRAEQHRFSFDHVCITAGAWSAELLHQLGFEIPVKPIRGQIVLLQNHGHPIPSVVELGRRYIVPRSDGLVLIGSTQEDKGFEKRNTLEGVRALLQLGEILCPALRQAEVKQFWSGLRPASIDELPLIGPVPGLNNVFTATGHFRSGLQMSVGTAEILSSLVLGKPSPISLEGLGTGRFENTSIKSQ